MAAPPAARADVARANDAGRAEPANTNVVCAADCNVASASDGSATDAVAVCPAEEGVALPAFVQQVLALTGIDLRQCRACGALAMARLPAPREGIPPFGAPLDTS